MTHLQRQPPVTPVVADRGFSLVELLVAMAIFSLLMAVAMSAFLTQVKRTGREYKSASTEMESQIFRNLLVRDLGMGGFGLADDYGPITTAASLQPPLAPMASTAAYSGTNGDPDTLYIRGTSLGINSGSPHGWSYADPGGTFPPWRDVREDLQTNADAKDADTVVIVEPTAKQIFTVVDGGNTYWRFRFNGEGNPLTTVPGGIEVNAPGTEPDVPSGNLLYGINRAYDQTVVDSANNPAQLPYYVVSYHLAASANTEDRCAPGNLRRLLRKESITQNLPTAGDAVASCVLAFDVVFGLDTNEDGHVNLWEVVGGPVAATYNNKLLQKRLKQVRAYILLQADNQDKDYFYPDSQIRVGDADIGDIGRDQPLTDAQRHYRWKLVTVGVTPRNSR